MCVGSVHSFHSSLSSADFFDHEYWASDENQDRLDNNSFIREAQQWGAGITSDTQPQQPHQPSSSAAAAAAAAGGGGGGGLRHPVPCLDYQLLCVVAHQSGSMRSGHYVCYARVWEGGRVVC